MNKKVIAIGSFLLCMLLITGCGSKTGKESKPEENEDNVETIANKEEEQVEDEVEEVSEEQEESEKEERESNEDNEVPKDLGDYNVWIGGEMVETPDKIIIHGESNLLEGARVVGEVTTEDESYFQDTTEIVEEDGSFYMEINHHDLKEETFVTVKFHFDGQQDDGIIRHYGDRGQKLEGPYIYKHQKEVGGRSQKDILKKAETTVSFIPEEEMAVRQFKEPTWYEIPEDMGSPRVWIEVDEINHDDEHFYIHGRSNLAEGSKINVSYKSYNQDETRVFPDGSFDFKLDYEYLEDTPFLIEFKPHDFQWNTVEEVYGKEGQNLVGNLVETNKYSNYQIIEKEVELEPTEIDVPDSVELKVDGSEITMLVPDNVLFDFDKYDLKDSSKTILKDITKALETSFNKKDLEIDINGHTDNVGNEKYNQELSEKRAAVVKEFLEEQISSSDVTFNTVGYGDKKPIASNDNEAGQAKNRRVEIVVNLR